jgi:FkbM family methyltransferase
MKKILIITVLIQLKVIKFLLKFFPQNKDDSKYKIFRLPLIISITTIQELLFDKLNLKFNILYDVKNKKHYFEISDGIFLSNQGTNRYIKRKDNIITSELFVKKILDLNKDYIVDVGSAFGEDSIFFAKKFPNKKIISVEPSKTNLIIQQDNIQKNNVKNIILVNAIISNSNEKKYISEKYFSENIIVNKNFDSASEIDSQKLYNFIQRYNAINSLGFLKIKIPTLVDLESDLIYLNKNNKLNLCFISFWANSFDKFENLLKNLCANSNQYFASVSSEILIQTDYDDIKKKLIEKCTLSLSSKRKNFKYLYNDVAVEVLFEFNKNL